MFEWSMRLEYDDFGILIALKTGGKYYCFCEIVVQISR